jgi:hypothetical protein
MTKEDLHRGVYKETLETWRHQVDSYWQRNNYFSAFETVALAGCWYVVEHCHLYSGAVFAALGITSIVAWLISNIGMHRYIEYWWKAIHHAEDILLLRESQLDFASRYPGSTLRPRPSFWVVYVVPCLFMAAWAFIGGLAVSGLCSCKPCIAEGALKSWPT